MKIVRVDKNFGLYKAFVCAECEIMLKVNVYMSTSSAHLDLDQDFLQCISSRSRYYSSSLRMDLSGGERDVLHKVKCFLQLEWHGKPPSRSST